MYWFNIYTFAEYVFLEYACWISKWQEAMNMFAEYVFLDVVYLFAENVILFGYIDVQVNRSWWKNNNDETQ